MPRCASSLATAAMNGCAIPAPAPCASTRQARARGGVCSRPETSIPSSTVIVIGSGSATDMGCLAPRGIEGAFAYIRNHRKPTKARKVARLAQERSMCRNIRTLFNFEPPATDDEIRASALQFVRKLSGFTHPSKANEAAFHRAVEEVAEAARRLIGSLHTVSPPRDREIEAAKARARARERFA